MNSRPITRRNDKSELREFYTYIFHGVVYYNNTILSHREKKKEKEREDLWKRLEQVKLSAQNAISVAAKSKRR